MASLVGIPLATTYGGGVLLKGRYHAFIPVRRLEGAAVQWHLISTGPRRITYDDIDMFDYERLLENSNLQAPDIADREDLLAAKVFLGWSSDVKNVLGKSARPMTLVI